MLNIKNPRAHELAVKVAAAHGETLTDAVIHSLEERLARTPNKPKKKATVEEIEALLEEIRKDLPQSFFDDPDPTAFLYDPDTGLPA